MSTRDLVLISGFSSRDILMLRNFARMMLRDRFLGSGLGLIWAVANPILMLGIFTFVFGFVFKTKLPGAETSLAYVTWLIAGYGPWLAISEGMTASAASITSNVSVVKNVAFKTELLPIAGALMGLVPLMVSSVYLAGLVGVFGPSPSWAWGMVIPIALLQFLFVAGIGLILSALNVFVRDVTMVLPNFLLITMFATPIFYPIDALPSIVRILALLNPFYLITEAFRLAILEGSVLPLSLFLYLTVLCVGAFLLGLFIFRRMKPYFDSRL